MALEDEGRGTPIFRWRAFCDAVTSRWPSRNNIRSDITPEQWILDRYDSLVKALLYIDSHPNCSHDFNCPGGEECRGCETQNVIRAVLGDIDFAVPAKKNLLRERADDGGTDQSRVERERNLESYGCIS